MVRNCDPIVDIETREAVNLLELHFDQSKGLQKSCIFNFRMHHKDSAIFNQIALKPMNRESRLLVIYSNG